MISLKNEFLRFDVDERGRITHLEDLKNGKGNIVTEPRPVFRAAILRTKDALDTGENKEDAAFAGDQRITAEGKDGVITIRVEGLVTEMGEKDASILLTISLEGEEIVFGGEIRNDSDSVIDELIYPCVGRIDSLGSSAPDLLFPVQSGERIRDIASALKSMTGREQLHEITEIYPGPLSMSFMMLTDRENCLYMACYDPLFHVMSLRARGSAEGGVTLEMEKMCFVKKGASWQIPKCVLRLYAGSWRKGADAYVKWAETWRRPAAKPDWVKRLNGYFLVINKQQYGFECWPYDTLPELYGYAEAHGCGCLGLFGWYHTGHDNNYPDLDVSPTMGGEEGLKKGIRAVQERGGRVTLYYQGHLMDLNSPFYRREGYKWDSRNVWGNPYYEFYPKYCYSDLLRFFSRKAFSNVCPSAPVWRRMMADRIGWIAGFGADGALYDQIGGMPPYPCFSEAHEHRNGNPALSYTQGRLKLLPAIREKAAEHESFAFLSEHITDLYSQFLDLVHGIKSWPYARGSGMVPGSVPDAPADETCMMPELFRYCFPETMITVRNPKPYMEERMTNYAFAYGFKFEMELRYDTDRSFIRNGEEPEKRLYAKKVADLRRKYEEYLILGTFRADEGIEKSSVYANIFVTADGRRAAALWNDREEPVKPELVLTNGRISGWANADGEEGSGLPDSMPPDSILFVLIED